MASTKGAKPEPARLLAVLAVRLVAGVVVGLAIHLLGASIMVATLAGAALALVGVVATLIRRRAH